MNDLGKEEEGAIVALTVAVYRCSQGNVPARALAKLATVVTKAKGTADYRELQHCTARHQEARPLNRMLDLRRTHCARDCPRRHGKERIVQSCG